MKIGWMSVVFLGLAALPASAHTFTITEIRAYLRTDDRYQIDVTMDVDAFVLGVSPETESATLVKQLEAMGAEERQRLIEAAREAMTRRITIRWDGKKVTPHVAFPDADSPFRGLGKLPTFMGLTARLEGPMPGDVRTFTLMASRTLGEVQLTIFDEIGGGISVQILQPGETSPPHAVGVPNDRSSGLSEIESAFVFLVAGFEHIIPKGLDHILFVLGLFLLSTKLHALLWQVTAFTVAHSVTLALSMLGLFSLPSHIVEPLIALSIAYVAIENVCTRELKPWRPAVVFVFGLLHGLGFAGVLSELNLPRDRFISALIGFNVGVEVGQLAVILLAFAIVGWFRKSDHYRRAVVIPASFAIAAVGLFWAAQRTFGA